jgi:predicted ATP-grasp superfamily ATP-dependent carboligase
MRVFVYEYTCAVETALADALGAEGRAMLTAVCQDLEQIPGVHTCTLRPPLADEATAFRQLARAADFTLVIAPESDGLLAERCEWVRQDGGRLLGPSPEAVRLTADKLALGTLLERAGVPMPPAAALGVDPLTLPAVLKPRYGAGSQATFLVRAPEELEGCVRAAGRTEMITQPFVSGLAASVAVLCGPAGRTPLMPAEQHLSADGRFHYRGGKVPLAAELIGRAQRLGERAAAAVPGLLGYVGVDLVLGASADGDRVIEINPRLTTSYIGLRRLARTNVAAAMLAVAEGRSVDLSWWPGPVTFRADGTITAGP